MYKQVIGIIAAEDEEMMAIKNKMHNIEEIKYYDLSFFYGMLGKQNIILVKCGVGKVNAARTTQILIDKFNVKEIINTGSAGGISEKLNIQDIVIADKLVQYDFDISKVGNYEKGEICDVGKFFSSDENLVNLCFKAVKEIEDSEFDVKIGIIASGDTFCADLKKAQEIRKNFNAECVEMEGAAIAQVCFLDKIPFLVMRGISDTPNGNNGIDFHTFLKNVSEQMASILEKMFM